MRANRVVRDHFVDVIASHMRGDIDDAEAVSRLRRMPEVAGEDGADEARLLRETFEAACDRFCPCGLNAPESWENTRRFLALLMTDRPCPRPGDWFPEVDPFASPRRRWLARFLLAALVASAATIPWLGPVPIIGCWLISACIWTGASFEHHRPVERQVHWPFATAGQWRESEPLLDRLALPAWERSVHYRPPRPRPGFAARLWGWGSMVFLMVMLFWILACTWPIAVWVEAFPREERAAAPPAG